MNQPRFERILRSIYGTRDDEILCSECFDGLSDYVDLEIAGADASTQMPRLQQHLNQCRVCREEHETLLGLARMDAAKGNSKS